MAIDKTDGTGQSRRDRKVHWAFMAVGLKKDNPNKAQGGLTKFRWVKVGSPHYRRLRAKGVTPFAIRTGGPRPHGRPTKKEAPSFVGNVKHGAPGLKGPSGTGSQVSGKGKGGGGKRRHKGGRGAGDQAVVQAVNKQIGSPHRGQKLDPGMADTLAGMQFDAPVHDLKVLIDRLGPQNAQALTDIGNWFGQAQAANMQAGSRDAQVAQDVAAQQDQATQGLLASLGGTANDGAGMLAAAGLNDSGLQRILGGIAQQSHSDMDPLLAQAAATAKTAEQRRNLEQMQDYQLQLADLMGQRGQAKAANLLDIRKYNNDLAQQTFQNILAKMQAGQAAASLGLDLQAKRADIRAHRQQAQRDSGKFIPWNRLNPAEKTQLLQAAVYKPDGTRRTLDAARQYLVSLGYAAGHTSAHNAAIISGLQSYYR